MNEVVRNKTEISNRVENGNYYRRVLVRNCICLHDDVCMSVQQRCYMLSVALLTCLVQIRVRFFYKSIQETFRVNQVYAY